MSARNSLIDELREELASEDLRLAKLTLYTHDALRERRIVHSPKFALLVLCETQNGMQHEIWFRSLLDVKRYIDDMLPSNVIVIGAKDEDLHDAYELLSGADAGTPILH